MTNPLPRILNCLLIGVLTLFPLACAHGGAGGLHLEQTLCTEHGPHQVTVVVDAPEHHHGDGFDERCPWCSGGSAAPPGHLAGDASPPVHDAPATQPGDRLPHPARGLPEARGPPLA